MTTVAIKLKDGKWITFETDIGIDDKFLISSEVVSQLLSRGISTHLVEEIIAN